MYWRKDENTKNAMIHRMWNAEFKCDMRYYKIDKKIKSQQNYGPNDNHNQIIIRVNNRMLVPRRSLTSNNYYDYDYP